MRKVLGKIFTFIIRATTFVLSTIYYYLETWANWFVGYNRKTEYVRRGACRKCGNCCRLLAIQYPKFFNRLPRLLNATIKWHELRFGFIFDSREENYLLYSCNFLRPDNTCKIYYIRPKICREYPKLKLYGRPPPEKNCGFYFTRRDGKPSFDEVLNNFKHI